MSYETPEGDYASGCGCLVFVIMVAVAAGFVLGYYTATGALG